MLASSKYVLDYKKIELTSSEKKLTTIENLICTVLALHHPHGLINPFNLYGHNLADVV
jgi:hypothetical protein